MSHTGKHTEKQACQVVLPSQMYACKSAKATSVSHHPPLPPPSCRPEEPSIKVIWLVYRECISGQLLARRAAVRLATAV